MSWVSVVLDVVIILLLIWMLFRQSAMVREITENTARVGQAIYEAIKR